MDLAIEVIALPQKILVGKHMRMNLHEDHTSKLWQTMMPFRNQIKHRVDDSLYSMQVYDNDQYFESFNPLSYFNKWAAVEVSQLEAIPSDFSSFMLESGLYAVYKHQGDVASFISKFTYLLQQWLPASKYKLAHRPHFELLGPEYKHLNPESMEEVWIPVQFK